MISYIRFSGPIFYYLTQGGPLFYKSGFVEGSSAVTIIYHIPCHWKPKEKFNTFGKDYRRHNDKFLGFRGVQTIGICASQGTAE